MKIKAPVFTSFSITSNDEIKDVKRDVILEGYTSQGNTVQLNYCNTYTRVKVGPRFMYIRQVDKEKLDKHPDISIPGNTAKLVSYADYAVPNDPDTDEWNYQDISIIINTARFRKLLDAALSANHQLAEFMAHRSLTILDPNSTTQFLAKTEKQIKALTVNIDAIIEDTAKNFA